VTDIIAFVHFKSFCASDERLLESVDRVSTHARVNSLFEVTEWMG